MASRWFNVQHVPPEYTVSLEDRPGQLPFPACNTIPVIDLEKASRNDIVRQILEAGQTYGLFQVINHGVPKDVVNDITKVIQEFFDMAKEDKQCPASENSWIYKGSTDFDKDGIHLWRESIKHSCHPLEKCMQSWPRKPIQYREIVSTYVKEIQNLSCKILALIGEGLGLEAGYLEGISQIPWLTGNYYPPCPDPCLTLGLFKHCDPSLITILLQEDVSGLQVLFKDGKWMVISAVPDAFVVNIGNQLQIISNGKLRSPEHRAVTNTDKARISIATFTNPSPNCVIEPAKVLVDELNPALYKPIFYKDFDYAAKVYDPPAEATGNPTGAEAFESQI